VVEGPPAQAETAEGQRTVVERRVIGHSVRDRPIRAYRVGEPGAKVRAVAVAAMHGDEAAPRRILTALRTGSPVRGVDLWLVPSANPDGLAARTRKNARGVDLNRNFPRSWVHLDGAVESGRGPASEPETRALMRFLERVDPRFVVSFHQPLYGVDTYNPKHPWFAHRLARELRLPKKDFSCGGDCHGTLTQWFNHRFDGVAVTVEYGRRPSALRMTERAPRQLLRALRGDR
jgi:protein MpaA